MVRFVPMFDDVQFASAIDEAYEKGKADGEKEMLGKNIECDGEILISRFALDYIKNQVRANERAKTIDSVKDGLIALKNKGYELYRIDDELEFLEQLKEQNGTQDND